jgi:hypothetical protein
LQSILNHISDDQNYEYSSTENDRRIQPIRTKESNILDTIDSLLNKLNEPNYSIERHPTTNDGLAALIAAADSCLKDEDTKSIP